MVDMRVLGKPSRFDDNHDGWRSWLFTVKAFAAAISSDLRRVIDRAAVKPNAIRSTGMTDAEATWSRQLHCILSRTLTGEAQRRLQSVTEGEGAEAWRIAADFYEPNTVGRYLGMMEDVVTYGLGRLDGAWGRVEQLKAEQSGEAVPENVRQAAFRTGVQDHGDQGPRGAPLGAI